MAIYDPESNQHSDGSDSIASAPSEFEISISGSGTTKQIIKQLKEVVEGLELGNHINSIKEFGKAVWEDHILITEISENED